MRRRAFLLAALSLTLAAAATTSAGTRALAADEPPPANQSFPACSEARTVFCVAEFTVDLGATGTFAAPPRGVILDVALFTSYGDRDSLQLYLRATDQLENRTAELAPALPTGTPVRIVVRTGSWEPPSQLTGQTGITSWSRTFDAASGWTLAYELRTIAFTGALNCDVSEGCEAPTDVRSYASYLALQQFAYPLAQLDGLTPEARDYNLALQQQLVGFAFGTSAPAYGYPPTYDLATGSLSISVAGPHLTASGAPNQGLIDLLVPDPYVVATWGADPDALAAGSALTVSRTDGSRTSVTPATITRVPGAVRIEVRDFTFSRPTFRIGVRKPLAAPSSVTVIAGKRRAIVTAEKVKRAISYQAVCARGAKLVYGKAKGPTVVVRGLKPGTWLCRARGVRGLGGTWSFDASVRVKA